MYIKLLNFRVKLWPVFYNNNNNNYIIIIQKTTELLNRNFDGYITVLYNKWLFAIFILFIYYISMGVGIRVIN